MYEKIRKQLIKRLERDLKPKRLTHSFGVEAAAIKLAELNHISPEVASIAALLHDIAKNMDETEMEKLILADPICKEYQIPGYPQLYHAFAGAEIVTRDYPWFSEEIINAVRYHTTGRPNMGTLEKIIFSADYIEDGRKPFPGLESAREMTYKDLDLGVFQILTQTLEYLKKNGAECHYLTLKTYNYMFELIKNAK